MSEKNQQINGQVNSNSAEVSDDPFVRPRRAPVAISRAALNSPLSREKEERFYDPDDPSYGGDPNPEPGHFVAEKTLHLDGAPGPTHYRVGRHPEG